MMSKRRRNRNKTKDDSWFKRNSHLVAWIGILVSILSVAVTVVLAIKKPKSQLFIDQVFTSILEPHIKCNEFGWSYEQEMLDGFLIRNNGDKPSTVSQGIMTEGPKDENIRVYAELYYFTDENEYLAYIDAYEPLQSPFNFRDTREVAYSIPLTIDPGITKNLMVRLYVSIIVKSGDPFDIIAFRDKNDWNIKYVFETSEALIPVEVNLSAIPMFGPQLGRCPPSTR